MPITQRGIPEKDEPVHLIRPSVRGLEANKNTYCGTGNWHIYHTDDLSKVTCEKCKKVRLMK